MEQFGYMENSAMLSNLEYMKIRCVTQEDIRIKTFVELANTYKDLKYEMEYAVNKFQNDFHMMYKFNSDLNDMNSETLTLKKLWDDAQFMKDDTNIFYFHSKGITSYITNISQGSIKDHRTKHYWRNLMNWSLMTRWKDCVHALKKNDVVSINYLTKPYNHFGGNFWWTKASHIKRLPDPSGNEWREQWKYMHDNSGIYKENLYRRNRDEMWVCSHPDTVSFDLLDLEDKNIDLHSSLIPHHILESKIRKS
jgi:hypothetical protein